MDNLNKHLIKYSLESTYDCIICKDTYHKGDYFYKTKCSHTFCIKCSEEWFGQSKKCPLCMNDITEIELKS